MNNQVQSDSTEMDIARAIRDACVEAAKEGFRDASIQGLCNEGAVEAAVSAIQMLDVEKIVAEAEEQK
jgi:hypothetical protein